MPLSLSIETNKTEGSKEQPQELKLIIRSREEIDRSNNYRCFHQLYLEGDGLDAVDAVRYSMPGQGFQSDCVVKYEAPFAMDFGPCWGRPHVTIDVSFPRGKTVKSVYSQNLPSKSVTVVPLTLSDVITTPRGPPTKMNPGYVNLPALRKGNKRAVRDATASLKCHGFCFLKFGPDWTDPLRIAGEFLRGPMGGKGDRQGATRLTGHLTSKHKDILRVLTGEYTASEIKGMPLQVREPLSKLAREFDRAQLDVVRSLSKSLFGCLDVKEVGAKYDVPLLQALGGEDDDNAMHTERADDATGDIDGGRRRYALLDLVLYRMDSETPDTVVSSHVDPGLLVLALPQSAPGLQLQTASGQWVKPPKGHGVMWTGAAATLSGARGGRHRVVRGAAPRIGCWHELCTSKQITRPMLDQLASEGKQLHLGSVRGTRRVLDLLHGAEEHDEESLKLIARVGVPTSNSGGHGFNSVQPLADTVADFGKMHLQRALRVDAPKRRSFFKDSSSARAGMPMSKSGIHSVDYD